MMQLPAINDIYAIVESRDNAVAGFNSAADLARDALQQASEAAQHAIFAHKGTSPPVYDDRQRDDLTFVINPDKYLQAAIRDTDMRTWAYLIERTGMRRIMDAEAVEQFERSVRDDCPPITVANVESTLDHLFAESGAMFARGVVNTFSRLDRRFKSHDGFKIGSRIILTRLCDDYGFVTHHGRMRDTLIDMERAIAVLQDKEPLGYDMVNQINDDRGWGPQQSAHEFEGFTIKIYQNGNAHLWFRDDDVVRKINEILRSHYGEVLPDGVHKEDSVKEKTGTAVSKDLQFYATPLHAVKEILAQVRLPKGRILEPSAGKGNMCRALVEDGHAAASITAIEYDQGRAETIEKRGLAGEVINTNFFDITPHTDYDAVLMNPPFYATHWMDHVYHAWHFLKPGGVLVAILPVTAEVRDTKKHKEFQKFVKQNSVSKYHLFRDLPEGTFKESGTMVNTVWIELRKSA